MATDVVTCHVCVETFLQRDGKVQYFSGSRLDDKREMGWRRNLRSERARKGTAIYVGLGFQKQCMQVERMHPGTHVVQC